MSTEVIENLGWIIKINKKRVSGMKIGKEKTKAALSILLFGLSIIPVLYLARYVHATGDDYGYGMLTHAAWLDTHSLWEVLRASFHTISKYYGGWQGTWFSIFLFSIQPEVFSPKAYWIVPFLMLFFTVVGTTLPLYYFLVKKLGFSKSSFIIIDCAILFIMIQFFPSTKSGIFWYNGAAHYIIPYSLAMLSIYFFIRYIDSYGRKFFIGSILCMTLLGGGSYLAALLAPIVLILLLIRYGKKRHGSFCLLFPLGLELIGLAISFMAPGNKVRGGEDFGFSLFKAFSTIGESFYQGFFNIGIYLKEKPMIFIVFLFIALVIWNAFIKINKNYNFKWPFAFCILMFSIYCAMFAPGIYAGTELSGGVPNMIFQVFVLTTVAGMVYLLGWFSQKMKSKHIVYNDKMNEKWVSGVIITLFIAGSVLILLFGRSTLKATAFYKCVIYIASGQAADYGKQMDERLNILLDDTVKDVKLPAMNQDQGPLMHMEVTKDVNGWTNQVVKDFYRKNSVIEIDRVQ